MASSWVLICLLSSILSSKLDKTFAIFFAQQDLELETLISSTRFH